MTNTWRPLAVTLAIQALVAMALIAVPVMAPVLAQDLGISSTYVGIYVGVVYAAAMLASLSAGAAVARFGAIRVSQVALVLCAAGLALSTLGSVWAMALGAVLVGLGYGPVTPASSHLLARTTPADRMSLVFSIKQTGVPLGGVLAGALVPPLLVLGWRGALLAVAAANIACIFVAQPLRAPLDADRDPHRPLVLGNLAQPIRIVLAHPPLRLLAGVSFLFSIAQLSLTTYLVTYLHDILSYGLVAAGLALSVSQAAGVVGRVLWGYVSDRYLGARRMLATLAALVSVCALLTAALQPAMSTAVVLVVLALFGASAIGWNGVYLAEVAREAPAGQASIATGGTLAITFLGVVLGPPAFGALSGATGSYRIGFVAVALALVLCLAALLRPLRKGAAPIRSIP
ncbi:MFS transporter [Ramlibacter sp. AN1133]|uniref:MFS transporter n=1 Tax=Ramlibacter sp. AN1133 TaxID=3133429 RepID=UPI0030C5D82D